MQPRTMRLVASAVAMVLSAGCTTSPDWVPAASPTDREPSGSASSGAPTEVPGYRMSEIASGIATWDWRMNDAGQVVGTMTDSSYNAHPLHWDPDNGMSDLGDWLRPTAINDVGQVAGQNQDPAETVMGAAFPESAPFLWDPTSGLQDVGLRPTEESYFEVSALSDTGQLVGTVSFGPRDLNADSERIHVQAAVWDPSRGLLKFGLDGTRPVDVNAAGQVLVVGSRDDDEGGGWVRSTHVWIPGNQPRHVMTSRLEHTGTAINVQGQVLIEGMTQDYGSEYLLWDPTTGKAEPIPLNSVDSSRWALNDRGQVAGTGADDLAAVWDPQTGLTSIGTVPGATTSSAASVNNKGQVVGHSSLTIPVIDSEAEEGDTSTVWTHAFVWDPANGMVDLGLSRPNENSQAIQINDRGDVLAWSAPELFNDTGTLVIWPPQPPPQ